MFDELGASSALEPALRLELVSIHIEFGWPLGALGKSEESVQNVRRAVQVAEKLDGGLPRRARLSPRPAQRKQSLARSLTSGQPEEAEKILRRNLPLADDAFTLEGIHRGLGHVFMASTAFAGGGGSLS